MRGPDLDKIEQFIIAEYGSRKGAKQEFNALKALLDSPSQHVWITFQDGCMWWCTVRDGAQINPDGESDEKGNFWLECDLPWTNTTLQGKTLAIADLPGAVSSVAGFRATICTPKSWQTILRIINGDRDLDAVRASEARREYENAVLAMVKKLTPMDFELLIDLILIRTGWARISTRGKVREGIDIEAENIASAEIAFVQIKSRASQTELDDYIVRFEARRDYYSRMIFAVHTPHGAMNGPEDCPEIQVWKGEQVSKLVVRLGLGEWVENMIS